MQSCRISLADGTVALVLAALIPPVAAILGGLAGMRFHRKVDQAGIDHEYRSGL